MKHHKLEILEDALPLSLPLLLMIDPTNRCNFKCVFCATGDDRLLRTAPLRSLGDMPLVLFKKIIDDIDAFLPKKIKRVQLYKDGEPLLHPNIIEMISYAKASGAIGEVDLTSNGSLIDDNMADALVGSGLDSIRISFEGSVNNEKTKKLTLTNYTYEDIKAALYRLAEAKRKHRSDVPYIQAKIIDTGLTEQDKQKFSNDFYSVADEITIDSLIDRKQLTGKVLKGKEKPQPPKVCPIPFYNLSVNSDGSVSTCCFDWNHSTLVGDLREESLHGIWNSEKLLEFRKMHVEQRAHEHPTCSKCVAANGLAPETNIDRLSLSDPARVLGI